MIKTKKISTSQLKYFFIFIWILIAIVIIFSGWFLYNNFYKVIIDSGEVLILEGEDSVERVNLEKIKDTLNRHQNKIETREVDIRFNF